MSEPKGKLQMTEQQKKRRSPAEILAAKQAEMQKLAVRAAKDSEHPAITRLQNALAELNVQLVGHQRGFSKGPQSFDMRIQSHQKWIDEIQAAKNLADASIVDIHIRKQYLMREINSIARGLAENKDVHILDSYLDEVIFEAHRQSEAVRKATAEYNKAAGLRRAGYQEQESEAGA
jgi:hypothetical protein